MRPEQYFFRYAWPCTEILLQTKRVSQERFDNLRELAEEGETPSREILEDTYKGAFENLKKIAQELKLDYWDISVIKRYFIGNWHNEFINNGGGTFGHAPEPMKDMCRINIGIVEEIGDRFVTVKFGTKQRRCFNIYNLHLEKGDKVSMHYAYVIEKVI